MFYSKSKLFSREYVTPVCKTRTVILQGVLCGSKDFEEIEEDGEGYDL